MVIVADMRDTFITALVLNYFCKKQKQKSE